MKRYFYELFFPVGILLVYSIGINYGIQTKFVINAIVAAIFTLYFSAHIYAVLRFDKDNKSAKYAMIVGLIVSLIVVYIVYFQMKVIFILPNYLF